MIFSVLDPLYQSFLSHWLDLLPGLQPVESWTSGGTRVSIATEICKDAYWDILNYVLYVSHVLDSSVPRHRSDPGWLKYLIFFIAMQQGHLKSPNFTGE